jgi:hypothetical protein
MLFQMQGLPNSVEWDVEMIMNYFKEAVTAHLLAGKVVSAV